MMETLEAIVALTKHPVVVEVLRYLTALLGAITMYLYSLHKGFEGTISRLKLLMPRRSAQFYHRLDFVLSAFLGALIGLIIFQPQNFFQAFVAGLSWVAAVNIVLQQVSKTGALPQPEKEEKEKAGGGA